MSKQILQNKTKDALDLSMREYKYTLLKRTLTLEKACSEVMEYALNICDCGGMYYYENMCAHCGGRIVTQFKDINDD